MIKWDKPCYKCLSHFCDLSCKEPKHLKAPQRKEPEQEPVATLDDLEQEIYENTRRFVSRDVMEWMLKRYYTTPPQREWVGLTDDDEIPWDGVDAKSFAKAIEAKIKEKNF